ncbi:hypothetical protein Pla108_03340 [Botrimarina colliarenosi]|uniref:Uncharacterized protein n=1 Tax=Botrimarina colliarenosi TaxID=2528001 RepID=A0A5C6AIV2_9BACT|nr:hypothetical protein [Botrimarina colliarenosi]TWT99397.1 hypothetical protein Pla108_03340 [Botrimarina colliarenosi]
MNDGNRVWIVTAVFTLLYGLGYAFERLRFICDEHSPLGGLLGLLVIGAATGMFLGCLTLSDDYLRSPRGKGLVGALGGADGARAFRNRCRVAFWSLFAFTAWLLWYAFIYVRD